MWTLSRRNAHTIHIILLNNTGTRLPLFPVHIRERLYTQRIKDGQQSWSYTIIVLYFHKGQLSDVIYHAKLIADIRSDSVIIQTRLLPTAFACGLTRSPARVWVRRRGVCLIVWTSKLQQFCSNALPEAINSRASSYRLFVRY